MNKLVNACHMGFRLVRFTGLLLVGFLLVGVALLVEIAWNIHDKPWRGGQAAQTK